MGLSVWPAPEDSGVVGPTGATGPKGDTGATGAKGATGSTGAKGDTGPIGKSVLQGAAVPAASLGVDGDVYLQKTENTFLGVTSATVAVYTKASGVWTKIGTDLRGAAWYVNTTSTGSADTKPGDMLLRTDTGDLWQRSASGWGTAIGNLKGATGAPGPAGPQGPKGSPGSVDTVNGKAGPAVTLTASDVGAMPTGGGTFTADVAFNGASGAYRQWSLDVGSVKRWTFQKDDVAEPGDGSGSNFRLSSRNDDGSFKSTVIYGDRGTGQISFGSTLPLADAKATVAGGLGLRNTSNPTANTGGATLFSNGGKLKVMEGGGQVVTIGAQPDLPSVWEPEDLGLKAWAYDPAISHSVPMYCGTTPRLAAVKLNKRSSITKIVWHFGGYAGGLISGSWAAIYNASTMARVGNATTIEAGNEPAEQHGSGGNASATTLDAAVTLDPGVYYVVWRFNYNTTTGDGPMILGIENSYGGPANTFGLNNLWRYGRLTTSPTTSPSPLSGIANESNRFWVALA
ncbi:collagen-like protein [Streptomyces sp. YPW6]|uniref:collagen-like triple helix repeat-containing protein n=1 Tax=Streptomyces sp. YPW6 TaxID=2840373 RepID=UPI001C0BB2FB|nr:collagen-like protein [Streptomyces sp. YPW6]QWQ42092.1 collagen-like protein [Streptomyces sp. YPW6]